MSNEINFDAHLNLKDAKLSDVQEGFKFNSKLGNIIKWYIVGLHIRNDALELKETAELFSKNGSLYAKRAYLSEAKAVHKALVSETIKVNDLTLAQLADTPAQDLPSLGVLYKGIPKKEAPKQSQSSEDLKAAREILKQNDGAFNGLSRPADIVATAKAGIPVFQAALDQAKLSLGNQAMLKEFPEVTTDNLNKITVAMKHYLTELHAAFPEEFEDITHHAISLDTAPAQLEQAA